MNKLEFENLLRKLIDCKNEKGEIIGTLHDIEFIKLTTGAILSGETFYKRCQAIDESLEE